MNADISSRMYAQRPLLYGPALWVTVDGRKIVCSAHFVKVVSGLGAKRLLISSAKSVAVLTQEQQRQLKKAGTGIMVGYCACVATLIHQTETFTNLAPIDKSDLLAFDKALDDYWPQMEAARQDYIYRKARENYHRYYEGMYSAGEEEGAKIMAIEAELRAETPRRGILIEFESDKKMRGDSFREILRHTDVDNEVVKNVFVIVTCGEVSASIYISPSFGIFDKNYLSIKTEPEENPVAVELFRVLREWAVSIFLDPKDASIRRKAYWYSSLVWGGFTAFVGLHAYDYFKHQLDLTDVIVLNGWNIAIIGLTAMYISKLGEAKFNGIAIGKGVGEVKKSKEHVKFYYKDLPIWFVATLAVIVLTEVIDYFVKYNGKP